MSGTFRTVAAPDGRAIEVCVEGADDGTLLVFHHGSPGSAVPFPTMSRAAAERGIRLATISRAGYGGSSRLPGRSVADASADSGLVADAFGAERFMTAGASGGGPHALGTAARFPDRVLAAATIAGVGPWDGEGLNWLAGMGEENVEEYSSAERDPPAHLAWIEHHVEELKDITADRIVESLHTLISEVDAHAIDGELGDVLAASFRAAFRNGPWGWYDDDLAYTRAWGFELDSIRVPVAIWQGAQDLMVPFAHGEWLAEHVPGAHARLRPEHGHLSLEVSSIGESFDDLLALASGDAG